MNTEKDNINQDTTPALAFSPNENIGRLYFRPGFTIPNNLTNQQILQLVTDNVLVPSVTNIIGVKASPFLLPWGNKLVAETAVNWFLKNPELMLERIKLNYQGAINFFKNEPIRQRDKAGLQGSNIHTAVEQVTKGLPVDESKLTEYELASLNKFREWLNIFQPEFSFTEITGFGKTEENMGWAGTTDTIMKINNKQVIADYKCVVDDTPILLADGSSKPAIEIKEGDEVVAWDSNGLHTSLVSYVGDNGFHKTITVTTASGHKVTTTENHPFWASRKNKQNSWMEAKDLLIGDELYIATGWNYAQYRQTHEWPFRKNFSPYLFGLMWALRNFSKQDFRNETLITLPKVTSDYARAELKEIGFQFNKAGQMNTTKGFAKIARKNNLTVDEVFDLIDTPELPNWVYGASKNHTVGFFTGVRELFINKKVNENELFVVLNREALNNLHQLYINSGQPATVHTDFKTGLDYLKVPFESDKTIYSYGTESSKIVSLEVSQDVNHTVAIEVAGSHTHITGGLITHNTNRSGLNTSVGLQLAANARADELTVDNETFIPMPEIDDAVGIHISPNGVKTQRVDISDKTYDVFRGLRKAWQFHAFESKTVDNPNGILLDVVTKPEDM